MKTDAERIREGLVLLLDTPLIFIVYFLLMVCAHVHYFYQPVDLHYYLLQHPPFDPSNLNDNSMRSSFFITGCFDSPSLMNPCLSSVTKAKSTVAEDDQLLSDRH